MQRTEVTTMLEVIVHWDKIVPAVEWISQPLHLAAAGGVVILLCCGDLVLSGVCNAVDAVASAVRRRRVARS